MGLFDVFKKKRQEAPASEKEKPVPAAKRPETYDELINDLLTNQDRHLLYEDCHMIGDLCNTQQYGDRYSVIADVLERAAEKPLAKVNYEFVIEHVLEQYIGETDLTYTKPQAAERLSRAVANLYEHSGDYGKERLEFNATGYQYNVLPYAMRGLSAILMENAEMRHKVLLHMSPIKTESALFCMLDFIVRHKDDPSDAERNEVRDFIKEKLSVIALCNTGQVISDNRVKDVPEYFRRIYLPLNGKGDDAELIAWFDSFWPASEAT